MSRIFKNITIILLLPLLAVTSLLSVSTLKTDVQSQSQSEVAVSNPDLSKFEEVFPGHNKVQADRVNLIFGFEKQGYEGKIEEAKQNLRDILYWEGEPKTIFYENDDDQPDYLTYGLFAIEPLRSMKDKFNLWFYKEGFDSENFLTSDEGGFKSEAIKFSNATRIYIRGDDERYEYESSYAQHLSFKLLGRDFTEANQSSYRTKVLPQIIEKLEDKSKIIELGGVELYLDFTQPLLLEDEYVLTHELGHALFDFSDEYSASRTELANDFKINCANTKEEAQRKWGDLIGQYDPFMDKVAEDYKRIIGTDPRDDYEDPFNGEPIKSTYLDDGRVGIVEGKCAGGKGFAPTFVSMMSYGENYWNPVQRRQIETIMATFSGEELTANNQSSSSVSSISVAPSSTSSTTSSSVSSSSSQSQEKNDSSTSFTSGVEQSSSSSSSQSVSTSGKKDNSSLTTPRTGGFNLFGKEAYLLLLLSSFVFLTIGFVRVKKVR